MEYGNFYITAGIADAIAEHSSYADEIARCLNRYFNQDWGDLCQEDKELNREALRNGERLLAAYMTSRAKIYIITEWDRSCTTILFTEEY